ncbi:hypothetical protein SKAU_G00280830 [Synaphobranchus kaupii]|uniref:Uncharacterized protein n=1 Tax=Synaphobranchus kaupii TaxID=118154 RepID=A0A9Q1EX17_SYNKA|nr:hypothetical protein SKAU_G00280830 [Synaphobranchus kaupii]
MVVVCSHPKTREATGSPITLLNNKLVSNPSTLRDSARGLTDCATNCRLLHHPEITRHLLTLGLHFLNVEVSHPHPP